MCEVENGNESNYVIPSQANESGRKKFIFYNHNLLQKFLEILMLSFTEILYNMYKT